VATIFSDLNLARCCDKADWLNPTSSAILVTLLSPAINNARISSRNGLDIAANNFALRLIFFPRTKYYAFVTMQPLFVLVHLTVKKRNSRDLLGNQRLISVGAGEQDHSSPTAPRTSMAITAILAAISDNAIYA
jgi:hypothetical protein